MWGIDPGSTHGGPGSVGSGSMPPSPAMMSMKTPPGTPRTPKTPPGSKSPTRGGTTLQQQQQHPLAQAMGGAGAQYGGYPGMPQQPHLQPPQHPGAPMMQGQPRPGTPTHMGVHQIRSPVLPAGGGPHMMMTGQQPRGTAPPGQMPPGPTMGNPPPPYPVQQPSGGSGLRWSKRPQHPDTSGSDRAE